ncbi:MAG TPA: Holliday junction resolvase RuvX [Candidatus Azosocius sp. HAIN]
MKNIVFGFDFGMKYVGLSVGEFITCRAWPLKTFFVKNEIFAWDYLNKLVDFWKPCKLVIGISFGYYKNDKTIFFNVKKFEKLLYHKYKIPIYEIGEDFTTWEAKYIYKQKNFKQNLYKINSLSAAIILEDWLKNYIFL